MHLNNKEEVWKSITDTNNRYEVSSFGNIRNAVTKKVLKTQDKHGYRRLNLTINGKSKNISVHREVAKAFIPNPENKPQVNHKDGVHNNNHVENLEWVTANENLQHAIDNNLHSKGMEFAKKYGCGRYNRYDKPKAYLSKSEYITKANYEKIIRNAEKYGVSAGRLSGIVDKIVNNKDIDVDFNKCSISPSEQYNTKIIKPYVDKISILEKRIDELKTIQRVCYAGTNDIDCAIGNKRNHLQIIGYARNDNGKSLVCQCDCGNIVLENVTFWKNGKVKSCGCMHDELVKIAKPCDIKKQDWLYSLWCRKHRKPEWYPDWCDYDVFYDWSYSNGYEFGLHLHKKDTNKPFSPGNCIWKNKTQHVEHKNKEKHDRYLVNNEMLTVTEACEKYNMIPETIKYRIKRGMSLEEAINTPLCNNGRKKSKNTNLTVAS